LMIKSIFNLAHRPQCLIQFSIPAKITRRQ
jgi:hypothetical protein